MEEQKQQEELEREETHLVVGDVEVRGFQDIKTTYEYLIKIFKDKDVKEYLKDYQDKKKLNGASYLG